MTVARLCAVVLAALATASCTTSQQSALSPAAPQSGALLGLMTFIVAVCTVVWLLVMLMLFLAVRRGRGDEGGKPDLRGEKGSGKMVAIGLAVAGTAVVITVFTVASFLTTRSLTPGGDDALVIRLRAYQWWWEATYLEPGTATARFKTANEIHVPTGRPVRIELSAADVIHSFWVPSLTGKQDMIPGRDNVVGFTAERPGVYRGQCAEFCGLQHAHMAMLVIADRPEDFERWQREQSAPALAPLDPVALAGEALFLAKPCAACHTVRGTPAAGTLGPDLTHVASRRTIAAGLLETTRGSLAAWIADPQTLKPGNNMPMVPLSADELQAVSAYMAGLR
jgi:cytochrome c oxidase subunit II